MALIRHFGFVGESHGTTHERPFMVAIFCKNFVMACVQGIILNLLSFAAIESPVITSSASKFCALDPLPTAVLKEFLPELLPFLTDFCNASQTAVCNDFCNAVSQTAVFQ